MNFISEKTIKKLQSKVQKGIKTIFVEGPADVNLYRRIYPNADIKHLGSCDKIIEAIKECNRNLGKTSLIVGIIDRDLKTDKEVEALSEENIFVLKEREIESIFLREDVICKLFGKQIFQDFVTEICNNASKRIVTQITDYNQALATLKKEVSSKFSIRILFKIAGIKNRGNTKNIDLLCSMMDKKEAWDLIKNILPDIDDDCMDSRTRTSQTKRFNERIRNFKSKQNSKNIVTEYTEEQHEEEKYI